MSDPIVKTEEPVITRPLSFTEPGATRDTAIDVENDMALMPIKSEPEEPKELPMTAFREYGHDNSSAILIIDDDDDNDGEPSSNVNAQLRHGTSVLPDPNTNRRSKEQIRLLRQRLRSGFSNEGYGPIASDTPAPQPSEEPKDEDEHMTPANVFAKAKAAYDAKSAANQASMEDDIEFMQLSAAEMERLREEEANARDADDADDFEDNADVVQSESDDGLFVRQPAVPKKNNTWPGQNANDDHDNDVFDVGEGPSTDPTPRNERGRTEEMEQQLRLTLVEDGRGGKKRRKKNAKSDQPRKRAKRGEGKKRKSKKKEHPAADISNPMLDAASLFTANVFTDAAANENMPELPAITETRKDEALKKLIASVPLDQRKKAMTDKKELFAATKKFSRRGARPDGAGGWKITGMETSLKNYQLLGAGFMRERERAEIKPHGGICADAMGLGKTLMMIANIVNDRPKKAIPGEPRATLIVLPATLVAQWDSEFMKHVSPKLKLSVLMYKAGSRLETHDTAGDLGNFDVVLTTYHEVQQSYPKAEMPLDKQTSEEKNTWWRNHFEENKGILHRVEWKRVVLDEAQQIKNYKSRTSLACRALTSKYRWALSGTPILNGPLELYAYFKFLSVPYTGSYRVFKANYYGDSSHEPLERLSIMVNRFMIRRTHKDTMFGAPILKLPKASERIHWVKFNDLERAIYGIVHRRMVERINSFSRENTLQQNYRNVLTMLLRLRQMTGNILLVEVVMKDLLEREDHEKICELAQIEVDGDEARRDLLIHLRKTLSQIPAKDSSDTIIENITAQTDEDTAADPGLANVPDEQIGIGRMHGLTFNFGKYLADLRRGKQWEELQERTLCVSCRQPPDTPFVTACYHIYCRECLLAVQQRSAFENKPRARCMQCQVEYSWAHPCDEFDLDMIMSEGEEGVQDSEAPVKRWQKKKLDENKVTRTWIENHGTVLPSAKTIAVKAQILNWLEKDPDCKILVYTQFIPMITIMKKICQMEEWSFQEYSGQMSIAARDKALESFKDNKVSILLASLKAGGLGLNLTAARHVISIDPWWNSALEQQAFCRVFRIGQTEVTSMTRFVVEGTIDERMINMQDRKQKEIDQVMGDAGVKTEKLSVHQMMRLFGPVREDQQGRPFVLVEDKETLPRFNADSEDEGDED